MRCFIAIDINENIRTGLRRLQDKLQARAQLSKSEVKWVQPELVHLTLKFLGEVRDSDIGEVCRTVGDVASDCGDFSLEIKNLGCFGATPRVVWVGVDKSPGLLGLQKRIDQSLERIGFASENREFAGHLTLCRIKRPAAGRKLKEIIKDYSQMYIGSVDVKAVCVYKSELTKTGPIYTLVAKSPLVTKTDEWSV